MAGSPVRYHVLHETRYEYGSAISLSQQQLHLSPRVLDWQQVEEQRIDIDPQPTWRRDGQDAFGNPVTWIAFHAPHDELHIRSAMTIAIAPHLPVHLEESLPWEEVRDRLAYDALAPRPEDLEAMRFLFESAHIRIKHELADYAADCFPPGAPVLVGARALMAKIFEELTFDPEATDRVHAGHGSPGKQARRLPGLCPPDDRLPARTRPCRPLCQRLPADPPATRQAPLDRCRRFACLGLGLCAGFANEWVDFDPTNNLLPDTQHITVAIGRDFGDISPLRGVILGGGSAEPEVEVTVTPLAELFSPVVAELAEGPAGSGAEDT